MGRGRWIVGAAVLALSPPPPSAANASGRLSVSRVLQKAFVIVDEEATEAAAVIANAPGPPPRADTRTSGARSARSPSPSGG